MDGADEEQRIHHVVFDFDRGTQEETIRNHKELSQNRPAEDQQRVIAALEMPFGRRPDDNEKGTRLIMQKLFGS